MPVKIAENFSRLGALLFGLLHRSPDRSQPAWIIPAYCSMTGYARKVFPILLCNAIIIAVLLIVFGR